MSDITLQNIDALGDYLTDEVYEISVVQFPAGFVGIDSDDINFRCNGMTISDTEVVYLEYTHRTFGKSQPTHRTNYKNDITMSLVETATPKTLTFLRDWANRCAIKGTNYVYPPEMRQAELLVYLKRNDRTTAWVWNIKNCQLATKSGITLSDGSGPQAIVPSITFNSNLILEGPNIESLK